MLACDNPRRPETSRWKGLWPAGIPTGDDLVLLGEAERPDDRTADSPTRDAASDEDKCHGETSIKNARAPRLPTGSVIAPAGLKKHLLDKRTPRP